MADQANNFGPLTPEQHAQLQSQAVQSGASPLEFMIAGGAPGAAVGYGAARLGRTMAGVPKHEAPLWLRSLIGAGGAGAGAAFGAGIGYGDYAKQQDTMRDAEGQPGGFYGPGGKPPTLADILKNGGQ